MPRKTKIQQQIEGRVNKLKEIQATLENSEEVQEYLICESLSYQEQQRLRAMWDKYFEDVKKTTAYKLYQICRYGFKKKRMDVVKRAARLARIRRENGVRELQKPSGFDPVGLSNSHKVIRYLQIADQLEHIYAEYQDTQAEFMKDLFNS